MNTTREFIMEQDSNKGTLMIESSPNSGGKIYHAELFKKIYNYEDPTAPRNFSVVMMKHDGEVVSLIRGMFQDTTEALIDRLQNIWENRGADNHFIKISGLLEETHE